MKKNYDFSKAIKNPYAKRLKRVKTAGSADKDNGPEPVGSSCATKKRKAVESPHARIRSGRVREVVRKAGDDRY